jgi:hypothetical protein
VPAVLGPALSVAAPTSTRSIEYAPLFDLPIPAGAEIVVRAGGASRHRPLVLAGLVLLAAPCYLALRPRRSF